MKKDSLNDIGDLFVKYHDRFTARSREFENVLVKIYFEGKAWLKTNVVSASEAADIFEREANMYFEMNEIVFFPYVEKHIPKYEAVTRSLGELFQEFRKRFKCFRQALWVLAGEKGEHAEKMCRVRECGDYLIHLLLNQLLPFNEEFFKRVNAELRGEERSELARLMTTWRRLFEEKNPVDSTPVMKARHENKRT